MATTEPPAENIIDVAEAAGYADAIHWQVGGGGNLLRIGCPSSARNVRLHLLGNAHVEIGAGCVLGALFVHAAPGSRVIVGDNVGFNGHVRLLLHEARSIVIGSGCLISGNVDITVSDMHSIVDAVSGKRVNPPADVSISERVWIGQNATILKGANIGADCVIGASAVVTGTIPANCVAAGNPARVVRQGIRWRHKLI